MTCMAQALASSGLTSVIPMATCGRWFSPRHLQHNDRKKEKKFCQSFCVILFLCTARSGDAKGLNKGVPTAQARESLVKRSGGNIYQHGSRIYRDSWRPREQPQGCRASAAQAQNHHFYRRVWFGEVIGGI